jgi:hypothetical protein
VKKLAARAGQKLPARVTGPVAVGDETVLQAREAFLIGSYSY